MSVPVRTLAPISTALSPPDERPRLAPGSRPAGLAELIEVNLSNLQYVLLGHGVNLIGLRCLLAADRLLKHCLPLRSVYQRRSILEIARSGAVTRQEIDECSIASSASSAVI